jgi:hypothetical protein
MDTWVGNGGGAARVFCESERDVREAAEKKKKNKCVKS